MSRNITPDNYDPNDPEQLQYVLDRRGLQYDLEAAGVSIYPEDHEQEEGEGFQDLYSHTTALNGPGAPSEDDSDDDSDESDESEEDDSDDSDDEDEDDEDDEEEVDLNQMSVPELKEQLKARKLATGGNKEELIDRLLESINSGE